MSEIRRVGSWKRGGHCKKGTWGSGCVQVPSLGPNGVSVHCVKKHPGEYSSTFSIYM